MMFRFSTRDGSTTIGWLHCALLTSVLALSGGCGGDSDADADGSTTPEAGACSRDADCGPNSFCEFAPGARSMSLPKNAQTFACFEECVFGCDFFDEDCEEDCAISCGLDQLSCDAACDYFCEGDGTCRNACVPECEADRAGNGGNGGNGGNNDPTPPPGTTCSSFCADECAGVPFPGCVENCVTACEGNVEDPGDGPGDGTPPPTAQGTCRPNPTTADPVPNDPTPNDPAPADMNWVGTWSFEVTYTANCRLSVATQPPAAQNYIVTGRLTGSNADITASFDNNVYRMSGTGNNTRLILSGSFPGRDHRNNNASQVERDNNIEMRITEIVDANTARGTITGTYDTRGGVSCEIADGGTVEITR